jgi:hypothetical protein
MSWLIYRKRPYHWCARTFLARSKKDSTKEIWTSSSTKPFLPKLYASASEATSKIIELEREQQQNYKYGMMYIRDE